MDEILQNNLPFAPWADPRTRRLPGVLPVDAGDWLRVDDAYAGQMALRGRLIAERPAVVHRLASSAMPAAVELLERVLQALPVLGFRLAGGEIIRPDGAVVALDYDAPLITLGHLCQEDFCILERQGDAHVLTGAILCFPASWTLAEKFMRPLIGIHTPVESYDADMARRVQRLFDAIRPDQPLWRANALRYSDPSLHHPRTEAAPRIKPVGEAGYIRSERQCLLRLVRTQAVVFSIHTYLVRPDALTPDQAAALVAFPIHRATV